MQVARRGLARTFQTARIFPELTVFENALLGRQWRGVGVLDLLRPADAATRERADSLIDMMGIRPLVGHYAGNISGGQRRLLELVMAMMSGPSLVMLDEATSGGQPTDRVVQAARPGAESGAGRRLRHRRAQHRLVFSIADRIVVLNEGRLLAEGTPEEIRQNPEVVDAYLGA